MQIWMLSAVVTILGVGFIGLIDDYLNIPQKYKIILPAIAGLPLAFAFIDRFLFWVPFFGYINLGIFYPLLLIPIGITASSNLTNMYAGLNGLEIGCGLITCTFTFLAAAIIGRWSAVIVLAPMIGALAAFLLYNRFPARIFPGDVGTMAIGACLAVAAIVGRIKIIAVVALIPYIINFLMYVIKVRYFMSHPEAKFASVREDGTLKPPEGGEFGSLYYAMMHLFKRGERWHVYLHYLLCTASGVLAILVGIIIYEIGIPTF
jgi:UDP-N-acetylglucosamine--dolichyl-phosphate N-acetylglucosaminephosphotransferase